MTTLDTKRFIEMSEAEVKAIADIMGENSGAAQALNKAKTYAKCKFYKFNNSIVVCEVK